MRLLSQIYLSFICWGVKLSIMSALTLYDEMAVTRVVGNDELSLTVRGIRVAYFSPHVLKDHNTDVYNRDLFIKKQITSANPLPKNTPAYLPLTPS